MFDQIAKDLLKSKPDRANNNPIDKANALVALAENGFSFDDVCRQIRDLYDETDDSSIKRQLLDMVIKVQGMYTDKEKRDIPQIIFNIKGDSDKFYAMVCPPLPIPTI